MFPLPFHTLDPDGEVWRCITCETTWDGAYHFMHDDRDCRPAWADRAYANAVSPLVWEGMYEGAMA